MPPDRGDGYDRTGQQRMATDTKGPTLGESGTTATIARWLKHQGDAVAIDEPLVELETDKVTVEVPSPAAGTLAEITAADGAEVEVGAVLGLVGEGGAKAAAAPGAAAPAARPAAASPSPEHAHSAANPAAA